MSHHPPVVRSAEITRMDGRTIENPIAFHNRISYDTFGCGNPQHAGGEAQGVQDIPITVGVVVFVVEDHGADLRITYRAARLNVVHEIGHREITRPFRARDRIIGAGVHHSDGGGRDVFPLKCRLDKVEIYPFKQAIEAGVQAIMTAHLQLPALDPTPDTPATLSPLIITGLLREEIGFDGLIVTDAMDMGGVTTLYSPEVAALKAVQAGVDIILLPPKPDDVIESLIQAVRNDQISEARINISVKRILEAKARLGLHKKRLVDLDILDEMVATKEHLQNADQVFESSITLVKNEGPVLPLSGSTQKIAVFSLSSDPGGYFAGRTFIREVKKRCPGLITFYADAFTGEEFIQEAVENSSKADVIVFALFSSRRAWKGTVDLDFRHIQLVQEAAADSSPVVVVSFGSPYFLRHFSFVDSYICAYRWDEQAQKAAVRALFGEIDIKGRLPVSLPGLYPAGHGLALSKRGKTP